MKCPWTIAKWSVWTAASALAACTAPAGNNVAAEANSAVEANEASAVEAVGNKAAGNVAGNDAAPATANSAAPDKPAAEPAAAQESYYALGQEPGWALKIAGGRLDYSGNYGEVKINVARPEPKPTANGRSYVTDRLTVDITYARCNDAMSGFGFEHQVTVTADDETFKGCGGARKKDWDV